MKTTNRQRLALLATTALTAVALAPRMAMAQNATWLASPGSGNYNSGANWSTGTVPSGTATFGASGTTSLTASAATSVGGWTFGAGASAYTFTTAFNLSFNGAGIAVNGGSIAIGNAGAVTSFNNASTAGAATITNDAFTFFSDTSTAGNATITNNGAITFLDSSTAGSATLNNTGFGSLLSFADGSSAGTATVTTGGISLTQFTGTASGGTARFIVNAGGQLDFSGLAAGTTAGSIEGNGSVSLGANALTVGGNNRSTTFGGSIDGTGGSLGKTGTGTLILTGSNSYDGGTTITGGTLQMGNGGTTGTLGTGAIVNNAALVVNRSDNFTMSNAMSGTGTFTKAGGNTVTLGGDVSGFTGTTNIAGGGLTLTNTVLGGDIVNNGTLNVSLSGPLQAYGGSISGTGRLVHSGSQLLLTGANTYTGGTFIGAGGGIFVGVTGAPGSIVGAVTVTDGSGIFFNNADTSGVTTVTADGSFIGFFSASSAATATYTVTNGGVARFQGTSTAAASTLNVDSGRAEFLDDSTAGSATIFNSSSTQFRSNASGGTARYVGSSGGTLDVSGLTTTGMAIGSIEGTGAVNLGNKQLTVGGNDRSTTFGGVIFGTGGSLAKEGTGTLSLRGGNIYSGGTTVTGGLVNFAALNNFGSGNVTLNGGGLQWATGNTADISARLNALGAGGGIFDTNGNNVTFASGLSGAGGLTKAGLGSLTLAGNNTYTGGTFVNGGTLVVNGSILGTLTLGAGGTLGGTGTIGGLGMTGGTLAPGNSIGTLNVAGNFVQSGGVYQVEVNAQGQSDRINATGTATITGGTVSVVAQPGNYARNTTYTILNATGGRTGTYSNVTSNFAFLTPTLSYDANNVFLNLAASSSAFASGAQTANQRAVGTALDIAAPNATGDFATVIGALSVLNTVQGPAALTAISGQNYAGFSNGLVQTGQLFMNNFAGQAGGANRVGGASRAGGANAANGRRVELAEACDVACEPAAAGTWGVWGGGIGAIGSIAGNGNSSTMSYNLGGFAGGLDRQVTPELLLGFTVGYASGAQSTQGFTGSGTSDTVQAGLYASFLKGPFYLDGLAGYAYSANQMTRQIVIPGLAPRTANGSTAANQFFGQIEAGYRLDLGGAADAYLTPFARLQGSTAMQNGFTETGAGSLNLSIAPQTTNSLRSVIGAQIGGAMDLGWREKLAVQFKLGWSHEFASTDRPVTAAFTGAPAIPFTTYGAAPNRDGVVVGFNAGTAIAERTSVYLRYEGNISGADNMHTAGIGLRMTW